MPSSLAAAALAAMLVDQTGHGFTLASLHGRPAIVTFVSAHCTDACPLIDAQFAAAATRIAHDGLPARLVTITLDPRRDTPATMHALAKRFDADPRHWLVAGGAPDRIDAVLRAFGVVTETAPDGDREAHTTFVYVLDGEGRVVRTMLASAELSDDLVNAARALAKTEDRGSL